MQIVGEVGGRWTITVDKSSKGLIVINQHEDYVVIPVEQIEDFLDAYLAEKRRK